MPYRNPMNCMHPGCPNKAYSGRYCEKHKAGLAWIIQYKNSKEWKVLRQQVLAEEPYCMYCGDPSTDVDHIIPLPEGSLERYNLQGLCKKCHSAKTRREVSR